MRIKQFVPLLALLLVALFLAACSASQQPVEVTRVVTVEVTSAAPVATAPVVVATGDTLNLVRERGILKCGGNKSVPGFGFLNEDGSYSGFDIDFCRAIAAAVLGDANAVEVRPATAAERLPILQAGEIDVLVRNTTWTISRDTSNGLDFGPVNFYDGQGMMVTKVSGITSLEELDGGTICVQSGTTTEKNLTDVFRALDISFEPKVFPDADTTRQAYDSGSCDGFTTDKSGLVSQQTLMTDPSAHIILDTTMSKEPLAPVFRHGDNNWGDIVSWTIYCTMAAEEYGITSANVDDFLASEDPVVQNLLGTTGELGAAMGLGNDYCYQVVKQVGNYGEIYDRNLGPDTPFNLPRGLNALYTNGGLIYAPPFR